MKLFKIRFNDFGVAYCMDENFEAAHQAFLNVAADNVVVVAIEQIVGCYVVHNGELSD